MGIQEQQLLRMLEPALRPGAGAAGLGGVGGIAGRQIAAEPIESRGFEAILEEAQQLAAQLPDVASIEKAMTQANQQTQQQVAEQLKQTTALFGELQHIENASVARIIGGDRGAMVNDNQR